jgi:hypothetical protein
MIEYSRLRRYTHNSIRSAINLCLSKPESRDI